MARKGAKRVSSELNINEECDEASVPVSTKDSEIESADVGDAHGRKRVKTAVEKAVLCCPVCGEVKKSESAVARHLDLCLKSESATMKENCAGKGISKKLSNRTAVSKKQSRSSEEKVKEEKVREVPNVKSGASSTGRKLEKTIVKLKAAEKKLTPTDSNAKDVDSEDAENPASVKKRGRPKKKTTQQDDGFLNRNIFDGCSIILSFTKGASDAKNDAKKQVIDSGGVVKTRMSGKVTHCVSDGCGHAFKADLFPSCKFVNPEWISECLERNEKLDEDRFPVKSMNGCKAQNELFEEKRALVNSEEAKVMKAKEKKRKEVTKENSKDVADTDSGKIATGQRSQKVTKKKKEEKKRTAEEIERGEVDTSAMQIRKKKNEEVENAREIERSSADVKNSKAVSAPKQKGLSKKSRNNQKSTSAELVLKKENAVTKTPNSLGKASRITKDLKRNKIMQQSKTKTKANSSKASLVGRQSIGAKDASQVLRMVKITNLPASEKDTICHLVSHLGAEVVEDEVSATTTHVISGDRRRSLNILKGISHGCWIVSPEWVYSSLERGGWLPEDRYEMTDWYKGIKLSRVERTKQKNQRYYQVS